MNKLTKEEAFKIGCEAFLKGLPGNPICNTDFWQRVSCINKHKEWMSVISEYQKGWSEGFRKKRSGISHESG